MSYGVLPSFSSQLYNFGNMNEASSSTSIFPEELSEIIQDGNVSFYSNNYYQQPDHRVIDVPILQPTLSPRTKLSDWRCQRGIDQNPKKRMNDFRGKKVLNKKLAHQERMQGCVPLRRSQKLTDKITALQKLVSPYGKTDTASVLQEAHLSINLLHDQIQKLMQETHTSTINFGQLHYRNEDAKTGLRERGLCLVPVSTLDVKNFMPRNF